MPGSADCAADASGSLPPAALFTSVFRSTASKSSVERAAVREAGGPGSNLASIALIRASTEASPTMVNLSADVGTDQAIDGTSGRVVATAEHAPHLGGQAIGNPSRATERIAYGALARKRSTLHSE